ncbi:MAG: hypothetical protein ACRCW9_03095 [Cetobacterium sp.]
MGLFDYKHEKKKNIKVMKVKEPLLQETKEVIKEETFVEFEEQEDIRKKLELQLRNDFNKKFIQSVNPYFDDELIKNIQILEKYLKNYFPDLPSYLKANEDGTFNISLRALMDARDLLRTELDINPEDLNSKYNKDSESSIKYKDGYEFLSDGTIWKSNEKVFDPKQPSLNIIYALDFKKMIISFEPGIHIPFSYILGYTKEFTNHHTVKNFPNKEYFDSEPGDSNYDENYRQDWITNPVDNPLYNTLVKDNPLITDKTPDRTILENFTFEDLLNLVPIENYEQLLKDFVTSPKFHPDYNDEENKGTSVCNLKDINYFKLMFLLIFGGGDYKNEPLPNIDSPYASINTKADFFLCERKSYQTGHHYMYSSNNRVGISKSILQIVFMILKPFFTLVNIPPLGIAIPFSFKLSKWSLKVEWKDVAIFPGLCIFGFLEHGIMGIQEWISKEINKMFECDMVYTTPVANDDGIGLDLKESKEPICSYFNRNLKICTNGSLDLNIRKKSGFYFCTKSNSCSSYIPNNSLYTSNKENSNLKENDIYSEGSAYKAILNKIDEQENVNYQNRG